MEVPETSLSVGDKIQLVAAEGQLYFFKNQTFIASGAAGNTIGNFIIGYGIA
jgi:hypothetical protein